MRKKVKEAILSVPDSAPVGYALRTAFAKGYSGKDFRQDFIAALVVSLVALPLSMALAIAVGLPPQHGIYTAIVAGIVTALLGGSMTQVSGPTAAFVVIVAPIVEQYGLRGLIATEILAGIMLIALGFARFGAYISYVPYPVTTGFTAGIAVVLATLSLNDFLGLHIANLSGDYIEKAAQIFAKVPSANWPEALVGMLTLLTLLFWSRTKIRVQPIVVGMCVGTAAAYFLGQAGFSVDTVGSHFTFAGAHGEVGQGIPPYPPKLHLGRSVEGPLFVPFTFDELKTLFMPAMTVAMLAALESLLSAAVADGLAGTKHQPNSELVGIGFGNIFSGLAAGIPATGAIARTATNIMAGARSPLASVMHALFIMAYVMLFSSLINHIPMASLSAVLLVTAARMSHYRQFVSALRTAPRSDVLVLLSCFLLTVLVDMVAGVTAGIMLSAFLFMKRMADLTQAEIKSWDGASEQAEKVPEGVVVYRINGPLFFGTAEKALDRSPLLRTGMHTLIIDLEHVPMIDMTGLVALGSLLKHFTGTGHRIVLSGVRKNIHTKILAHIPENTLARVIFSPSLHQALAEIKTTIPVSSAASVPQN